MSSVRRRRTAEHLPFPASPDAAVEATCAAIADAARAGADLVCFPECFLYGLPEAWVPRCRPRNRHGWLRPLSWSGPPVRPGWRWCWAPSGSWTTGSASRPRSQDRTADCSAGRTRCNSTRARTRSTSPGPDGEPFTVGGLTFGVAIYHEGFRYPETVRDVVLQGSRLVLHPHCTEPEPGVVPADRTPTRATPSTKTASLCRAAENTCWFASVNCAVDGSPADDLGGDPSRRLGAGTAALRRGARSPGRRPRPRRGHPGAQLRLRS